MNQLGLFAKFWQPGSVKTRLAATMGEIAACEVYQSFLFHLVVRHRDSADTRWVVFSPPDRESEFQASISSQWKLVPQSSGNLGDRMQAFFEQQFERLQVAEPIPRVGANKIVVIGADCPQLNPSLIQSAFDVLIDKDVVIGPSNDGGYYLIGMCDRCFPVFSSIQWSTPRVLDQTIRQLEIHQIEYGLLSPLTDVDDIESLLELVSDFESRKNMEELDTLDLDLYQKICNAMARGPGEEPE